MRAGNAKPFHSYGSIFRKPGGGSVSGASPGNTLQNRRNRGVPGSGNPGAFFISRTGSLNCAMQLRFLPENREPPGTVGNRDRGARRNVPVGSFRMFARLRRTGEIGIRRKLSETVRFIDAPRATSTAVTAVIHMSKIVCRSELAPSAKRRCCSNRAGRRNTVSHRPVSDTATRNWRLPLPPFGNLGCCANDSFRARYNNTYRVSPDGGATWTAADIDGAAPTAAFHSAQPTAARRRSRLGRRSEHCSGSSRRCLDDDVARRAEKAAQRNKKSASV